MNLELAPEKKESKKEGEKYLAYLELSRGSLEDFYVLAANEGITVPDDFQEKLYKALELDDLTEPDEVRFEDIQLNPQAWVLLPKDFRDRWDKALELSMVAEAAGADKAKKYKIDNKLQSEFDEMKKKEPERAVEHLWQKQMINAAANILNKPSEAILPRALDPIFAIASNAHKDFGLPIYFKTVSKVKSAMAKHLGNANLNPLKPSKFPVGEPDLSYMPNPVENVELANIEFGNIVKGDKIDARKFPVQEGGDPTKDAQGLLETIRNCEATNAAHCRRTLEELFKELNKKVITSEDSGIFLRMTHLLTELNKDRFSLGQLGQSKEWHGDFFKWRKDAYDAKSMRALGALIWSIAGLTMRNFPDPRWEFIRDAKPGEWSLKSIGSILPNWTTDLFTTGIKQMSGYSVFFERKGFTFIDALEKLINSFNPSSPQFDIVPIIYAVATLVMGMGMRMSVRTKVPGVSKTLSTLQILLGNLWKEAYDPILFQWDRVKKALFKGVSIPTDAAFHPRYGKRMSIKNLLKK